MKFKVGAGIWQHATLDANASNHIASNGSTINPAADGKGVLIYRSSNSTGPGTVTFTGTELRWDYGADGVADTAAAIVSVIGIEMVYVPQGSFYVGDGTTTHIDQQFQQGDSVTSPFQIASEGPITLGGTDPANLGNNNAFIEFSNASNTADDFNDTTIQTLPAAFPKGYYPFYCMKYELTQDQYVNFLNMLDGTQQANRVSAISAGTYMSDDPTRTTVKNLNGVRCITAPVGSTPGIYGNDLNGNGIPGEPNDGQTLSCNFLSWADAAAYLDWAGLRPMTELEFEKACRGPLFPVPNEYAWGDTSIAMNQYTYADSGTASEVINLNYSSTSGNAEYGATNYPTPAPTGVAFEPYGPVRVGIFADNVNNTGRITSGSSYYGITDLTGNDVERTISVGNAIGRTFTGTHGNGVLLSNGDANVSNWPGDDAAGAGRRGGRWSSEAAYDGRRVSDRGAASWIFSDRQYYYGIRGVRTSPTNP